jgi:uncharacterized membrane protein
VVMDFESSLWYSFRRERMKMKLAFLHNWLIAFALSNVIVGCSFHNEKGDSAGQGGNSNFVDVNGRIFIPSNQVPGYQTVKSLVFQNRCIECHGRKGGVSLETYASTLNALNEIKQSVLDEQSMPPRQSLSFEEQQLVRAWIDGGAPELDRSSSVEPVPTATPVATPFGIVRYADVETVIFAKQCNRCHDDEEAKKDVKLDTYDRVIQNLAEVEKTALIKLSMPRKKPLTLNDQRLLRAWIDQGTQK